jgi:hypothetical protein
MVVTLAGQGDLALALEILAPGLLRHPDSSEPAELRQAVLVRLMEQCQLSDPFGFSVYAELAGAELAPIRYRTEHLRRRTRPNRGLRLIEDRPFGAVTLTVSA